MKAIVVDEKNTQTFRTIDRPDPSPGPRDLLVRVKAVSVNPVDTKVRAKRPGKILGWDASGTVVGVGASVTRFRVGDDVYYAGDIRRDGTNAELHVVDERIVGRKPRTLDPRHAACMPLTALTAWEGLYEQLAVEKGRSILVIGAAGGVGSMVVQMAARLEGMRVIGTASRDESVAWVKKLGAADVVNHREDLPARIRALGLEHVDYVFCCNATDLHFDAMADVIAPQGRIVSIVESERPLPIGKLFSKKAVFGWELMFTKSMYETDDMGSQGDILDRVAERLDDGTLESTLTVRAGALTPKGLEEAHVRLASGTMIGKLGFEVTEL